MVGSPLIAAAAACTRACTFSAVCSVVGGRRDASVPSVVGGLGTPRGGGGGGVLLIWAFSSLHL